MARTRDRVIALIITILFFTFSFGLSFMVIWQLYKDNKEAKHVNSPTSSTSKNNSQDKSQTVTPANKLEGTQLANFTPTDHTDSLQKIDLVVGTGDEAKAGDTVTVDYTGAVAATGKIFQSSLDTGQPASLSLNSVIQGWKDGIPGMKVGGQRRLVIPAAQAYGGTPPTGSGIPANADLVFDVVLKKVGQ